MLVLPPVGAILGGFRRTLQVNLKAIPLANGVKSAPCRTKREAEDIAIEVDGPIEIIDQQLRRDSDLALVEYQVLAMLSNAPDRTMRMSSLAEVTNASLSRLSHLFKRLEGRGLVRREPDPTDGRFTNAILTEKGYQALAEAAPGHVAHVRSLVIDVLSPEQLRRLGIDADRIMSRIDTSGIN